MGRDCAPGACRSLQQDRLYARLRGFERWRDTQPSAVLFWTGPHDWAGGAREARYEESRSSAEDACREPGSRWTHLSTTRYAGQFLLPHLQTTQDRKSTRLNSSH